MTREELTQLFDTYLKRDFSEYEWKVHNRKDYNSFEHELQNCEEYLNSSIIDDRFKIGVLLTGHIRNNDILESILKYFTVAANLRIGRTLSLLLNSLKMN
jgi:hypothetical protein